MVECGEPLSMLHNYAGAPITTVHFPYSVNCQTCIAEKYAAEVAQVDHAPSRNTQRSTMRRS